MPAPRKDDQETRDRAVRMYQDRRPDFPDESALRARPRVGELLDVKPETLRGWIERVEIDTGQRPEVSSSLEARIKPQCLAGVDRSAMDFAELREHFSDIGVSEDDVDPDPIAQFNAWFATWREVAVGEADAMILATATADGRPSARTVMLRGVTEAGFVFFTNYGSRKGRELAANPRATLVFSWHLVGRQVVVEGDVERVSPEDADAYWVTRPRGNQLAARASPQSRVVSDRFALDSLYAEVAAEHEGSGVPRPNDWGGFRVRPDRVELWQGRNNRLHDRLLYGRDPSTPTGWRLERLAP